MRHMMATAAATLVVLTIVTQSIWADKVRDVRAIVDRPVAIRGGVMMVPLTAKKHGDHWPEKLTLTAKNGPRMTGMVGVIEPQDGARTERKWADDPRAQTIRPVHDSDDSSTFAETGIGGPFLVVSVPVHANGELRLGRQKLKPIWYDLPVPLEPTNAGDSTSLTLERISAPDRPDPDSPFEYWRWVLLSQRMNLAPPPPPGSAASSNHELKRLTAQHFAGLWLVGLDRLAARSPRVADRCRSLLTRTCIDRRRPFAAWIADPSRVGRLLAVLFDQSLDDSELLSAVLTWIEDQPRLVLWPENIGEDPVRLAAFTPHDSSVVARITWRDHDQEAIVREVRPGVLTVVELDRPVREARPLLGPASPQPPHHIIEVEADGQKWQVAVGPPTIAARPPGVFLRPLAAPLTLAEAQMSMQRTVPNSHLTQVHLRRLNARWELFFECRRPPPSTYSTAPPSDNPLFESDNNVGSIDDLRGREAVTILIGPDESRGGPHVWLMIPERGWPQFVAGSNDGTMQVHKKSFTDRWNFRLVLPESWIDKSDGEVLRFGCVRSHSDSEALETAPGLAAPWRVTPGRMAVDLTQWTDWPGQP